MRLNKMLFVERKILANIHGRARRSSSRRRRSRMIDVRNRKRVRTRIFLDDLRYCDSLDSSWGDSLSRINLSLSIGRSNIRGQPAI